MKTKKINKIFASLINLGILTIPVFCPTKVVASKILNEKVETGNKFKSLVNDAGMQFLEFVKEKQDDLQKEYLSSSNEFSATQTTYVRPTGNYYPYKYERYNTNINFKTNISNYDDDNNFVIKDPNIEFKNISFSQKDNPTEFEEKNPFEIGKITNPVGEFTAKHGWGCSDGADYLSNKFNEGFKYNWSNALNNFKNWDQRESLFSETNTFSNLWNKLGNYSFLSKYFFPKCEKEGFPIRYWSPITDNVEKVLSDLKANLDWNIKDSIFSKIFPYFHEGTTGILLDDFLEGDKKIFNPLNADETKGNYSQKSAFSYKFSKATIEEIIKNMNYFLDINFNSEALKSNSIFSKKIKKIGSGGGFEYIFYLKPEFVSINLKIKNIFPYYFNLNTVENGTLWQYWAHCNWTTILNFDQAPTIKQLKYDPNLLYQIKNIGYDTNKQKYFTQSGINDELMLGLMSTYYQNNDFLGANRFLNAQHKLKELEGWNERNPETHKIDKPNENTKLMTSGTFYYDKINGMNTDIIGGIDQWFPIGVIYDKDGKPTGQNGLSAEVYGNYGDFVKNPMFVALKEIINSFLTDKELDYSNYFKVREWCKNYCIKNHDLPVSWNEQEQKYQSEELKEAFRNELLADDWRENCQKYGINEDSIQDLKDLATFARGINFNQWDMVSEDSSSWTNTDQNQFVMDEQTNQDFAHFHKMIDPEQSNWTSGITDYFDLSNSNSDSFHLITNAVGLVSKDAKELIDKKSNINSIYEKHNYSATDTSFEFGNSNNLNSLKNRYGDIINQTTEKFINKHGSHTTTGWKIKKEGEIIVSAFDDSIWAKAENKPNVMVRAYADELGKDFYDENTVNPIFNKIEYEKNKYDMNNQPYLLKSPKDVIAIAQKRASTSSNDGNLGLNVLKEIFYDYKNNKKALPFIKANLLNLNEISYDLPSDRISVDVNNEEGDIEIKLWKPKADKKHDKPEVIKINNFEKGCEPFVPDVGLKSASIALIVSGIVGSLLVIAGIWYLHRYKNRKTSRLTKEARKYRKIKGED